MRLLLTGGSGFIGSNFLKKYAQNFETIYCIINKTQIAQYPNVKTIGTRLKDLENSSIISDDLDIIIHLSFDHRYKSNISHIKSLLKICKAKRVKKLIHLSTINVHKLDNGIVSEATKYSKSFDPYTREKLRIEKLIKKNTPKCTTYNILKPTIVYGVNGNWSNFVLNACKHEFIKLPNSGENFSDFIHVNDVVKEIMTASRNKSCTNKEIILSGKRATWRCFYTLHADFLKKNGFPASQTIMDDSSKNIYHSKNFINALLFSWFNTPLGIPLNFFAGIIKRVRQGNYQTFKYTDTGFSSQFCQPVQGIFNILGITRKLHMTNLYVQSLQSTQKEIVSDKYNHLEDLI